MTGRGPGGESGGSGWVGVCGGVGRCGAPAGRNGGGAP